MRILVLVILVAFNSSLFRFLDGFRGFYEGQNAWESEAFCALSLGKSMAEKEDMDCELLAALMTEHRFDLRKKRIPDHAYIRIPPLKYQEIRRLSEAYHVLFDDLKYFPVPETKNHTLPDVSYKDCWPQQTACVISAPDNIPAGSYPVVSISEGVLETALRHPDGDWNLCIRTPKGLLLSYGSVLGCDREWKDGDKLHAGELLGYMDTSVLLIGVSMRTENYANLPVNPYWILKYLENHRPSSHFFHCTFPRILI